MGRWAWLALLLVACSASAPATPPAKHASKPVVPHTFLAATAFLGENTAWVSIYNYFDGRSTLLKTDDAGRTWQERLQVRGSANWMRYFNARDAVVRVTTDPNPPLQTSIYRTLDGGLTWTAAPAPPNPIPAPPQVDFPNVAEGWLVQLPKAAGNPRVLFHTNDGGLTWNDVAHLDTAYDVGFRDPSTGWLARRPQNGSPALMVTRNGGLTWATQVLTRPVGAATGDAMTTPPRFIDSRDAKLSLQIISPAGDPPLRLLESYLYSSRDGGETWTVAGRLPLAKVGTTDSGTVTSFLDRARGWAGSSTSLYMTADGGATWTDVGTSLPRRSFYFAELALLSDRTAWGQLSDFSKREGHQPIFVLIRSTDEGAHWREVKVPGLEGQGRQERTARHPGRGEWCRPSACGRWRRASCGRLQTCLPCQLSRPRLRTPRSGRCTGGRTRSRSVGWRLALVHRSPVGPKVRPGCPSSPAQHISLRRPPPLGPECGPVSVPPARLRPVLAAWSGAARADARVVASVIMDQRSDGCASSGQSPDRVGRPLALPPEPTRRGPGLGAAPPLSVVRPDSGSALSRALERFLDAVETIGEAVVRKLTWATIRATAEALGLHSTTARDWDCRQ